MTATGNSTLEALNQGQAQACADAATITDQMHAFGEVGFAANFNGAGGSGPFSTCAAQDHLVEFGGDVYFNEGSFQAENPYVWSATQNCTLISANEGEVVGNMLAKKRPSYAGEADLTSKPASSGPMCRTSPPTSLAINSSCTTSSPSTTSRPVTSRTSPTTWSISTFTQQTQQAIVQFKAAGVTTVLESCDPISAGLLTQAASQQNYHPEWFETGTSLDDQDPAPQTYDNAAEITGHLFGLSELSPTRC